MPKRFSKDNVYDENGKRRFHGAFTGGFAAGYYNTVGTEEGWTPTSFISTRDQRVEFKKLTKEDFMDKDDNPLVGRTLETQNVFAESKSFSTHPTRSKTVEKAHTVNELLRSRKHYYGIGYKPIQGLLSSGMLLDDDRNDVMRMGDVLKGSTVNSANFGLGALEDEDDENIYASTQMSNYDRVLEDSHHRIKDREEGHHHHSSSRRSEIEGFVYSSDEKKSEGVVYPPHRVPSHFRERHTWDRPLSWDWVVMKGRRRRQLTVQIVFRALQKHEGVTHVSRRRKNEERSE